MTHLEKLVDNVHYYLEAITLKSNAGITIESKETELLVSAVNKLHLSIWEAEVAKNRKPKAA